MLRFAPASAPRFLVLNELYYPGWHAHAGDTELPILAANVVMRGVVVPAQASGVEFSYEPLVRSGIAIALSWLGVILLGVFVFLLRRWR